jgi:hypothetical protein
MGSWIGFLSRILDAQILLERRTASSSGTYHS